MKLKTQASTTLKSKLSSTLKSWLPILQSGMQDLEETLGEFAKDNPYFDIKSKITNNFSSYKKNRNLPKGSRVGQGGGLSDSIENFCIQEESLEESLLAQIIPPLFPTQTSQSIVRIA